MNDLDEAVKAIMRELKVSEDQQAILFADAPQKGIGLTLYVTINNTLRKTIRIIASSRGENYLQMCKRLADEIRKEDRL